MGSDLFYVGGSVSFTHDVAQTFCLLVNGETTKPYSYLTVCDGASALQMVRSHAAEAA